MEEGHSDIELDNSYVDFPSQLIIVDEVSDFVDQLTDYTYNCTHGKTSE